LRFILVTDLKHQTDFQKSWRSININPKAAEHDLTMMNYNKKSQTRIEFGIFHID